MRSNGKYPSFDPHQSRVEQEADVSALVSAAPTVSTPVALSGHSKPASPDSPPRSPVAGCASEQPIAGPAWPDPGKSSRPVLDADEPIDHHRSLPGLRAVRFGVVFASCALIQLLILKLLNHLGVNKILANGIGFAASASGFFMPNAFFSTFVREPRLAKKKRSRNLTEARRSAFRRAKLNATALVALAVNEIVFAITLHGGVPLLIGSATGILCGAIMASSLHQRNFVSMTVHRETLDLETIERRPGLARIQAKLKRKESPSSFPPSTRLKILKYLYQSSFNTSIF